MNQLISYLADRFRELAGIPRQLTDIRQSIDEQTRAIGTANERQRQQQQPTPTIRAELSVPESVESERRAASKDQYRLQKATLIVTTLTLISASVYAGIAAYQYSAMKDANVINRESLTSVQRAFVSFQRFEYFRLQDADHAKVHNWDIFADFTNNGATNATNVIGILQVQELPAEPTEEQFRSDVHSPESAIPPKGNRSMRIPRPVPEPLIFGTELGSVITAKSPTQTHFNHNLFVWSWVYYRDIFSNTKPHVTEVCSQLNGINFVTQNYNPSVSQLAAGNLTFNYAGCRKHNCDDEQCEDYKEIVEFAEKP
jgi:hypothetical protein